MDNKTNLFHNELNRTMERLKFAENKLMFLSAYYAIVIWFSINNKEHFLSLFKWDINRIKAIFFWLFFITFLVWIFFLFKVMFPNWLNKSTDKSSFYFSHVWKTKILDFVKKFKEMEEKDIQSEILEQIHINSQIVSNKMSNIKISTIFLIINLFFFLLVICLK